MSIPTSTKTKRNYFNFSLKNTRRIVREHFKFKISNNNSNNNNNNKMTQFINVFMHDSFIGLSFSLFCFFLFLISIFLF